MNKPTKVKDISEYVCMRCGERSQTKDMLNHSTDCIGDKVKVVKRRELE